MQMRSSSLSITPQTFWLWFGGIWLIVGVPFLSIGFYIGYQRLTLDDRLDQDGRIAEGIVLTKTIRTSSKNGNTGPSYLVAFRFAPIQGEMVTGGAEVTAEVWDSLVEREPIRVTYLPDAPSSYRIEGQKDDWVLPVVFGILGSILTALGGFVFLRGLSQFQRSRGSRKGMPS